MLGFTTENAWRVNKAFLCLAVLFLLHSNVLAQQNAANSKGFSDTVGKKEGSSRGLRPVLSINRFYRLHVGAAFNIIDSSAQKKPYAAKHTIGLNYSITEKSFHPYYKAILPQAFNNWNVTILAGYDEIRRVNFYGVGNDTKVVEPDNSFNWLRTRQQYASLGIDKTWKDVHNIDVSFLYDGIQVLDNPNRYVSKSNIFVDPAEFNWQYFLGPRLTYSYLKVNNHLVPTKGVDMNATAAYTVNLNRSEHNFSRYTVDGNIYIPLFSHFSAALRSGLATMTGDPDFYQLNTIGGSRSVRGFRGFRYYGKTAFYNQNELRWINYADNKFYKGHYGLVAHLDQGRVWQPGEKSSTMHYGYGGGIILAPFDKVSVTATYGITNEGRRFSVRMGRNL